MSYSFGPYTMTECVKTIKGLQALDPTNTPCVFVQGYDEPGDGGEGLFFWDNDFTESEDQGTVIKSNLILGKGRWRRIFDDLVSVKWFGAKGDMKEYFMDGETATHYQANISKDTLILTTPAISEADNGKVIVIWKDGIADLPLVTKITGYDDVTKKVTLEKSAPSAITGVNIAWGTDDTDAIRRAMDVSNKKGFTLYLPPGHFIITDTLNYVNVEAGRKSGEDTFPLMRQGLKMFGAGSQVSVIHNQIMGGRPTIRIDGAAKLIGNIPNKTYYSFQQTGLLKDFTITSTGQINGSSGIDLRATWGYTIQNVHILKMGSDGIVLRNTLTLLNGAPNSDGDASDKVYIDNVFAWKNNGWGIIVEAEEGCLSTSRIHIDRCKIEANELGGIQWVGQGGSIERCGIYGNAVNHDDGYGIFVKNVKATSNGLLIAGCEIQGNADVQVMIAVGANIKIVQNDFKVDDLISFPKVDIQVGDGNLGDGPGKARTVNACVIEDNRIRARYSKGWDKAPRHTVVKVNTNAVGTVIARWWASQYKEDANHKLVELVDNVAPNSSGRRTLNISDILNGRVHVKTHLHRDGILGGHVLLPFASTSSIIDEDMIADHILHEVIYVPDTSKWSSYYISIRDSKPVDKINPPPDEPTERVESIKLDNPSVRTVGTPLFLEFENKRNKKVVIRFGPEYDAGKGLILSPNEVVSGILLFDERGYWKLYTPWTYLGIPLKGPFSAKSSIL